jgi:sulfur relay (sulfurtransferase) DsrF/TusC family protein
VTPKHVLFLFSASPTAHLRFFEGLRMALGFSVSHRPVTLLLLGEGVRILLPSAPRLLGLPGELTEVVPLLRELGVPVLAETGALDTLFFDRPFPDFVSPVSNEDLPRLLFEAEIVLPFLRRIE